MFKETKLVEKTKRMTKLYLKNTEATECPINLSKDTLPSKLKTDFY